MRITKPLAVLATIAIAAGLTACGEQSGTISDPTTEATTEAVTDAATGTAAEETTEAAAEPTNPTFGQTWTWDDGLAITVSAPTEYAATEYAAGTVDGQSNIAFTVTVTNGTDEDISALFMTVQVVSGGKEGSQIFDTEGGSDIPTADILPGETLSWTQAFSVVDPADIRVSVENSLDFDSEAVHFTN